MLPPMFYSFLACGYFCCLLITFANSLEPDQDRQNIGPDLDPKLPTADDNKNIKNYPACKESNYQQVLNLSDTIYVLVI